MGESGRIGEERDVVYFFFWGGRGSHQPCFFYNVRSWWIFSWISVVSGMFLWRRWGKGGFGL